MSLAVFLVIILSSYSQEKNEAMELSRDFFTSLSDTIYGKPSDFYPAYDTLQIEAKSDVVEIEESDISEKNDTITGKVFQQLYR